MPASDAGTPCVRRSNCKNICSCPEGIDPADPNTVSSNVVGKCSALPPLSGGGFYCTIEEGRIERIIVD